MPIEILWILPIFAFAITLLGLFHAFRNNRQATSPRSRTRILNDEVELFNQGLHIESKPVEQRVGEIQQIIALVNSSLSNQQRIIEAFRGKDEALTNEQNTLKHKLREMQQEYDIVISENYSLRARINKLLQEQAGDEAQGSEPVAATQPGRPAAEANPSGPAAAGADRPLDFLKLYGDTRTFQASDLDDTAEINLNGLR
jgi:hypothetical protein